MTIPVSHTIMEQVRHALGDRASGLIIPPPVFAFMDGELETFNLDAGTLSASFPLKEAYLNPYGAMQGGMIAAAIDNTLGPLSVLLAPPNVTRRLEIKYSRAIRLEALRITVEAQLTAREGRWLWFKADVRDSAGRLMARASARHWILDEAAEGESGQAGGAGYSNAKAGHGREQ